MNFCRRETFFTLSWAGGGEVCRGRGGANFCKGKMRVRGSGDNGGKKGRGGKKKSQLPKSRPVEKVVWCERHEWGGDKTLWGGNKMGKF